ncbi:MAG: CBS domain-containing protein [Chloroflexi bacterium]|nr:CBS domain-containing protein [Chloroflexota bacterium]MCL4561659.1 CBS domain-containing protein [Chloroflexota bacterium]
MRVILTHEQADFDALAALLGAHLLQENYLPALPRRLNRNVRSFLTLYGADLPFLEVPDLPSEPVESILLVDTQSLVTLKGAGPSTTVQVIDHHQPRPDLPAEWKVVCDPTGAVTTVFVENLQEHNGGLNPLQATLLLLGIYEDTGSLTYAGTTSRDVRAAAYLLDQGASLSIAGKYLNPPLSNDQRQAYDRLLASAKFHHIHGQKIVITYGSAENMNEEVSSIAHKLRDLLDPDALFMLVTTGDGIRMVARSTTNRVNVAEISAAFGGGGHERAAAALIRQETVPNPDGSMPSKDELLEQTARKLLQLLPAYIRPSIMVGQIMSRRPRLISPQTSAQEAAQLMQRYGYEGYPVIRENKVIGLLTRRAVDRALAHKLNLQAASLMEAGEVVVHPNHSLEHLQQVMISSGWGQIPVVEPESGEIVGIVTRTDLLKTLSYPTSLPTRPNLSEKLEAALPAGRLALLKAVAEKAHQQRIAVYIVGGFVRDLLLDLPSLDFDVVVEGDAITLARLLAGQYGGQIVSHTRFGTAKWNLSGVQENLPTNGHEAAGFEPGDLPASLDLITARTEFYERPTALPVVERSGIKLDLHRRDFTINTMALRLDGRHYGELYDYWGGLNDLRRGLVRVLHSLSFIDDPTRALRAVRFEQRFGFEIESRTLQLMEEARALLKQVSGDRIRHEVDLILAEERASQMLTRLDELGLLSAIQPGLPAQFTHPVPTLPGPEWDLGPRSLGIPIQKLLAYLVWLAPLSPEEAKQVCARLKFSRFVCEALVACCRLRIDLPDLAGAAPSVITGRLEEVPLPSLYAAFKTTEDPQLCALIESYVCKWRWLTPETTGETLRSLGLTPGPTYRTILKSLRSAWLDGEIDTPEQEHQMLAELIKNG